MKGASDGAGLGNEFLSNISAVDGLFHMCRVFDDAEVIHVEGAVDPIRDLEIIASELRLKDLAKVNHLIPDLQQKITRLGHGAPKEMKREEETLLKVKRLTRGSDENSSSVGSSNVELFCLGALFCSALNGLSRSEKLLRTRNLFGE